MQTKVRPILMFQGDAEEAMNLYVALFPGSEIIDIVRYGPDEAGAAGTVMKATFSLAGQIVLCTDSIVKHDFTFTPAISFFVVCESEGRFGGFPTHCQREGLSSCRWASMASAANSPGSVTASGSPGN